jgi:hypothetical protein
MKKEGKKEERPEAYPKPTETDKQLDNQDEFIQPQSDKKNDVMPALTDDVKANKKTSENSSA